MLTTGKVLVKEHQRQEIASVEERFHQATDKENNNILITNSH